jgi:hypothetical protein
MKERPILFSAPMVRALLDGSKTQTRRVMKVQPPKDFPVVTVEDGINFSWCLTNQAAFDLPKGPEDWLTLACPYGKPGDQLWVREAFSVPAFHPSTDNSTEAGFDEECAACRIRYHADNLERNITELSSYNDFGVDEEQQALRGSRKKSVPSIHMPRWASRIQLEIVSVRVERLNDISESDAIAEGIENNPKLDPAGTCHWRIYGNGGGGTNLPEHSYETLWEQINGAGSWQDNPWVWCVEFRRVGGRS